MASEKKRKVNEPLVEEDFLLEDILAEYGGSRGQKLMEAVERSVEDAPAPPKKKAVPEVDITRDLPKAPRPISLEQMVGSTVDAVMGEPEPILQPKRGLFSRRKMEEDTERLFEPPEPEEEPVEEEIGEEPDLMTAASRARERYKQRNAALLPALFMVLVSTGLLALEEQGFRIPLWSGQPQNQAIVLLLCLLLSAFLCKGVFARAWEQLCII